MQMRLQSQDEKAPSRKTGLDESSPMTWVVTQVKDVILLRCGYGC